MHYDGLLDLTHGVTGITVTNSKLYDHWKASLVGHSDSNGSEDTPITVTYANNYWSNLNSRTPSFRFGHGHIFNNIFDNNNDGINTRDGAQLLVENNVWTGTNQPLYSTDAGYAVATGNDFGGASNTALAGISDEESGGDRALAGGKCNHLEPRVQFKSLIIVEPLISPAGPTHLNKLRSILVHGAHERRDVWPDREHAMVAMKKRARTAKWDPRIMELFVKHAIVPHPGSYEKETPYRGFTLACTRDQEAAMYRDADGPIKPVQDLKKACAVMPVHLILAGVNDFMFVYLKMFVHYIPYSYTDQRVSIKRFLILDTAACTHLCGKSKESAIWYVVREV
ncbi:hypothetical protein C0991_003018 [Blastosporella zonata]|nr:hypothetical protein C0991_003018 [Blastosporella zonata]